MAALVIELTKDTKPFQDFAPDERRERLRRLRRAGRGLTSGSEEFAKRKREEVEEREFGR